MKSGRGLLLTVLLLLSMVHLSSQNESDSIKNWTLSGYVKMMNSIFQINEPAFGIEETLFDGFLHNRLNFEWYPSKKWTFRSQIRNRFFYGELIRNELFTGFKESLKEGNDVFNLQLVNAGSDVILHSIIDRLHAEYTSGDWEITIGRQRINWGINTVWNPHDIFNAFAFTDFDYEERPGSDAIRIRKYTGYTGSIEFAFKAFDNSDEIVGGLLWKTNYKNYDLQFLLGRSFDDWVLGAGWAGALGQIGFKGEGSYFISTDERIENVFAGTLSLDYIFGNGTFVNMGMLYNGANNFNTNLFAFDLSARNLYPFQWSLFYAVNQTISPLVTAGLSIIHSPVDGNPLFINPTFTYSIGQNLDMDVIGQVYLEGVSTGEYRSPTKVLYVRLKWSF